MESKLTLMIKENNELIILHTMILQVKNRDLPPSDNEENEDEDDESGSDDSDSDDSDGAGGVSIDLFSDEHFLRTQRELKLYEGYFIFSRKRKVLKV